MLFKRPSILRNLLISFLAFGFGMGLIFPVYAGFFVDWKPGMYSWFAIGCLVAGGTIGFINYTLVRIVLIRKLERISDVARSIGDKDLSRNCVMESHDVIGELIRNFNQMTKNLREVIQKINHQAERVDESTSHLQMITENLKEGAMRQHSETDQVATAINEMTATVHEVSRHASETAVSTSAADEEGDMARRVIGDAMSAVQSLADNVENAGEVISRLKMESENIGSVLAVINGIAEQTNLLALNAAIEAARAGEQGRGFAVVAEEVRNLATRTQSSTQEISEMIDRLQTEANNAVSAMGQGREQAHTGVELTERGAAALNEIANAINRINEMNMQIADAAKEQAFVAEEINKNIVNVNEIANEAVSGVEQTAEDSFKLAEMSSQMKELVSGFKL